jgi:hypothetical protein
VLAATNVASPNAEAVRDLTGSILALMRNHKGKVSSGVMRVRPPGAIEPSRQLTERPLEIGDRFGSAGGCPNEAAYWEESNGVV